MYLRGNSIGTDDEPDRTGHPLNLSIHKTIGATPGRDYYLICVVAKRMVRTTINLVGTLHVVRYVHHKRGGTLHRGYGLKEQEMTM